MSAGPIMVWYMCYWIRFVFGECGVGMAAVEVHDRSQLPAFISRTFDVRRL